MIVKTGTLDISATSPADRANPGDTIAYGFALENTGNVTLTNVTVSDPLVSVSCPVAAATLDPGETATCTATYTITQADIDAGKVDNTGSVKAERPGGDPTDAADDITDSDGATVSIPQVRTISIVKTGTLDISATSPADRANPGDTIAYGFALENTGNVTLTNVTVSDPLVSVSCPVAAATLDPGETATCTATYTITQADIDAGKVDNTGSVKAERPGGDPTDAADDITDSDGATVSIPQVPAIALMKSASPSSYGATGDVITYTFTVTNTGNVTLAGPFSISDPKIGNITSCGTGPVAPNQTTSCQKAYVVTQADIDAGQITNTATASTTYKDETVTSNESSVTDEGCGRLGQYHDELCVPAGR